MSVLTFPNIKPHFLKTIKTPDYSIANYQAKSGYENTIRKSYQGYSTMLTLEYQHISQDKIVEIINFYNSVKGIAIAFTLPEDFFNVQDAITDSIASLGSTVRWKFANEPTLTLLVATPSRGVYNWEIQLKAVYPGSAGSDDLINPATVDVIDVADAPIVTPVTEQNNNNDTTVVITPVSNVDNPVETPDDTETITRLVRTKITLNVNETIISGNSLSKSLAFCKSFLLYQIDCTKKIRLRLYLNTTYRDFDIFRSINSRPLTNSGLVYEGYKSLDATPNSIILEPVANAYNLDDTNQLYGIHITNLDSNSISNFNIDFYIIPLEA